MAESTTITEPTFVKCPCTHCGIRIEFDADSVGCDIECPHCGKPTLLHIPDETPAAIARTSSAFKWLGRLLKRHWLGLGGSLVIAVLLTVGISQVAPHVRLPTVEQFSGGMAGGIGGILLIAVAGFLLLLALLWILFPFFVYFQLERIKAESIRVRMNSDLVEDHTRKLVELAILARKA